MFTPFQKLLPKTINKLGLKRQIEAATVCQKFRSLAPTLVREEILQFSAPQYYRGKTLTIGVANGAWAELIKNKEAEIVTAINAAIGEKKVERVRTTVMETI